MNVLKHDGAPPSPANTLVMLTPPSKKSGGTTVWPTPSVASEVKHGTVTLALVAKLPELVVAQTL